MATLNDNNPITADGTYTVVSHAQKEYRVELSGDFGGGTLSVQTQRGLELASYTAAGGDIIALGNNARLVLTGATDPSIQADITEL